MKKLVEKFLRNSLFLKLASACILKLKSLIYDRTVPVDNTFIPILSQRRRRVISCIVSIITRQEPAVGIIWYYLLLFGIIILYQTLTILFVFVLFCCFRSCKSLRNLY